MFIASFPTQRFEPSEMQFAFRSARRLKEISVYKYFVPTELNLDSRPGVRPLTCGRANLRGRKFGLHEQKEVITAAGFGIGARHVEAAKRMHPDERAGAFTIQIKIADMKFAAGALKLNLVSRVHCARQAELSVVGYSQRVVVVIGFDHRQHGSKYLFLLDGPAGLHVRNHRRVDEKSSFAIRATARYHASTLGLALFDIAVDRPEGFVVDDSAHRRGCISRITNFDLCSQRRD